MVEYDDLYLLGWNPLDQFLHDFAFDVNDCCSLSVVLILNLASFNYNSIHKRSKYSVCWMKRRKY